MIYCNIVKPLFDRLFALLFLSISLPIWMVLIPALLVANKGKVFFTQIRPGKDEVPFRILKFKTMNDKRDLHGNLLPDFQRLHPVGKFVRKTSIDELPQLLNILKGDMSFVGPRPLLMEYLPLYNERQRLRHSVMPGITGWAQINGRNAISWQQKFELDAAYIDKQSFIFDLKILVFTFLKVIRREGVNAAENNTMEPFKGNV
jgi:lipopolysaccharide/colanic/teichoic acid biosynthesis glycosyltransferase